MYFTSTLVNGGPLGSAFAGILGDSTAPSQGVKYIFDTPRDINGSYDFTYHLIDEQSFYFPCGYQIGIGDATMAPTQGGISGLLIGPPNTNVFSTALAQALLGGPVGRVLCIIEFID